MNQGKEDMCYPVMCSDPPGTREVAPWRNLQAFGKKQPPLQHYTLFEAEVASYLLNEELSLIQVPWIKIGTDRHASPSF